MKKKIIITFSIFILIILFVLFRYVNGWYEFRKSNYTPKEYKSIVYVSKMQYSKDSLQLVSIIEDQINKHIDPYSSGIRINGLLEYINDNDTHIYIDSIFYSPDLNRIAFLVIVENENEKLYIGKTKEEIDNIVKEGNLSYKGKHFDGNSFITEKENNTFNNIYPFSRYSFTNYRSYKEISESLRDAYLNRKNEQFEKTYNLDDKRFWNSNIWKVKQENGLK